ncbi:MAG TPA: hypothetical protein VKE96_07875 [Vicinamibacterales bacterium]|nr:hypothetical protein [Vicinamibacterales bacterium]
MIRRGFFALTILTVTLVCDAARPAAAQTDEIQVYDGGVAAPGIFNLTWHNNFTPKGIDTAPNPGSVVADKSFNGVTEWAYGVTKWFEAGLYLPLYTDDKNLGWGINRAKLRALFAVPRADDRSFFYGSNFEFSRVFGPSGAAARLGIARSTLESKIRALGINKNRFRGRRST